MKNKLILSCYFVILFFYVNAQDQFSKDNFSKTQISNGLIKTTEEHSKKVKIDIWSDVSCPFCFLGKKKLEKAINLSSGYN